MSDLQKEAAGMSAMSLNYQKISVIFDSMPDRFKLLDLMKRAGIKDCMQARGAVSSVLYRDFKCLNVGNPGGSKIWKKP